MSRCMSKEIEVAVCEECDSQEIHVSKTAFWDKETGEWYCDSDNKLYDTWCERCEGECNVSYIPEEEWILLQVTKRLKGESV